MGSLFAALAALTFCISTPARAFGLIGDDPELRGWEREVLRLNMNLSECPSTVNQALFDRAMGIWNSVLPNRVRLEIGQASSTTIESARAGDAQDSPLLFCDRRFGANAGVDPNLVPALTSVAVDDSTHELVYGYLVLNAQEGSYDNVETLPATQLAIVVAHELGHLLGLGHSEDRPALMYFDVTGKRRLELAPDDISGLVFLYTRPPYEPSNGFLGCGSISSGGPGNATGERNSPLTLLPFAGALALLLLLRNSGRSNHDVKSGR